MGKIVPFQVGGIGLDDAAGKSTPKSGLSLPFLGLSEAIEAEDAFRNGVVLAAMLRSFGIAVAWTDASLGSLGTFLSRWRGDMLCWRRSLCRE
jgi:hypothetical protein